VISSVEPHTSQCCDECMNKHQSVNPMICWCDLHHNLSTCVMELFCVTMWQLTVAIDQFIYVLAIMFSTYPFFICTSVCLVVCYQTCERDILKKKTGFMPNGTSGPCGKRMKRSTLRSEGQRIKVPQGWRLKICLESLFSAACVSRFSGYTSNWSTVRWSLALFGGLIVTDWLVTL